MPEQPLIVHAEPAADVEVLHVRAHPAQLAATDGPIVAATDYVRAVPEQVRAFVPAGRRYATLGTDGFGRSDSREAVRGFFEVDARHIALRALVALADDGALPAEVPAQARARWGLGPTPAPWTL